MVSSISEVSLVNDALAEIGHEPFIVDLKNDKSRAARFANQIFQGTRDEMLRAHIWRFALKRARLAKSVETLPFGRGNIFPLPTDFVRLVGTSEDIRVNGMPWAVEGRNLIIDVEAADIVYVSVVEDVNSWDYLFRQAFVYRLADRLCGGLVRDQGIRQYMNEMYNRTVRKAAFASATEQTGERILSETFLNSRI